jgi:hypothetical protein
MRRQSAGKDKGEDRSVKSAGVRTVKYPRKR